MSSGSAPCSGYVLKATMNNFKKLDIYYMGLIRKHVCKYNDLKIAFDLLLKKLADEQIAVHAKIASKKIEVEVYKYDSDSGDIYDELENGEFYLIFGVDDLYESKPTPVGLVLKKKGIFPELKSWTRYG